MDPRNTQGRSRRRNTAAQRAHIRQLRVQQMAEQESQQSRQRRGMPMWGRMLVAVGVVLLMLLIFFRVSDMEVSGNVRYSAEEVETASGVTLGDVLMGVNKTRAASRILVKLPYVRQVVISKALPGTVRFQVAECQAVTAALSESGALWLLNREGKLLEKVDTVEDFPVIQGVALTLPLAGDQAVFADGDRGALAMETALAVEDAGLTGDIRLIDVSDPGQVLLRYQDRIEVQMGDASDLSYRLQYLLGALERLGGDARGALDLSFTGGDQAVFHPVE